MIRSVTSQAGAAAQASSATDSTAIAPGGKLGKNEFLQLLVTQLRHQDPMNPMDGQRMAADLAQFTGLEQLVNIGQQLEGQQAQSAAMAQALNNSVALGTIGKTVTAISDQVAVTGDGKETVTAQIAGAGTGVLRIYDAAGKEVGSRPLGAVKAGTQTFELGAAAEGLEEGGYTYAIDVKDASGRPVETTTYATARVDGITYSETGAKLTAGPLSISIGSVIRIVP